MFSTAARAAPESLELFDHVVAGADRVRDRVAATEPQDPDRRLGPTRAAARLADQRQPHHDRAVPAREHEQIDASLDLRADRGARVVERLREAHASRKRALQLAAHPAAETAGVAVHDRDGSHRDRRYNSRAGPGRR